MDDKPHTLTLCHCCDNLEGTVGLSNKKSLVISSINFVYGVPFKKSVCMSSNGWILQIQFFLAPSDVVLQ